MKYYSTNGKADRATLHEAVVRGLASDKGLFMPEVIRHLPESFFDEIQDLSFQEVAYRVADAFFGEDVPADTLKQIVYDTLSFDCPVVKVTENIYSLELFHGPTLAFKDVGARFMARLLGYFIKQEGCKQVNVLVATSGDTGKAAMEGFADVPQTKILVFYPKDGVSKVQETQMVTQDGANVGVCAVEGNFDDAQAGVKRIFSDEAIRATLADRGYFLSSANSINWGRILPQVVYYISAYCDLVRDGKLSMGDKVNFCVPTGNFGDILAAYYAKRMGLPVGKLICASNCNDVLTDFLRTGVYDKNRPFHTTMSPSMDILVSSNLERLLFDLSGENDAEVKGYMDALAKTGKYEVSDAIKAALADQFWGGFCGEAGTSAAIAKYYKENGYLIDTHTAVAFRVAETRRTDAPMVVLSTASPFKFPRDVLTALGVEAPASDFAAMAALTAGTGAEAPASLRELDKLEVRFKTVLQPADIRTAALR